MFEKCNSKLHLSNSEAHAFATRSLLLGVSMEMVNNFTDSSHTRLRSAIAENVIILEYANNLLDVGRCRREIRDLVFFRSGPGD